MFGRQARNDENNEQRPRQMKKKLSSQKAVIRTLRQINVMQTFRGRQRQLEVQEQSCRSMQSFPDDKSLASIASINKHESRNPFKKLVHRGIRKQKKEKSKKPSNTAFRESHHTSVSTTPEGSPPQPIRSTKCADNGPRLEIPDGISSSIKLSFTPIQKMRLPSNYQLQGHDLVDSRIAVALGDEVDFHNVIENVISNNLYNDKHQLPSQRTVSKVNYSPQVIGCSVLAGTVVYQTSLTLQRDTLIETICLLEAERESWEMARMHLRSRLIAARAAKYRKEPVEKILTVYIHQSKRCQHMTVRQVVEMDAQLKKNLEAIKDQIRQKVLVTVTRSLLVSNPTTDRVVLNQLGIEMLIPRLKTIRGLKFDPREVLKLIQSHGQTTLAAKILIEQAMSQTPTLFAYDAWKAVKR